MPASHRLAPLLLCVLLAACTADPDPQPAATSSPAVTLTTEVCPVAGEPTQIRWSKVLSQRRLLGTARITMRPNEEYNGTPKISPVATFTAGVTSATKLDPEFQRDIIVSLAERHDRGGLAAPGESSGARLEDEKLSIAASKTGADLLSYRAVEQVTGEWKSRTCELQPGSDQRFWSTWTEGTATSWTDNLSGALDCADKPRAKETMAGQAARIGC